MMSRDHARAFHLLRCQYGFDAAIHPRPCIAEPERRQQMQRGRFRSTVGDADSYAQVIRARLGVFNKHIEVAVFVEDARVEQLILQRLAASLAVRLDEIQIRIRRLRILIEILHIRMRRRAVQIEVVLLDVFAMIAFAVRQTKKALLKDRILPVPERQRETENLVIVGNARQTVLTPAIRPRPVPDRE